MKTENTKTAKNKRMENQLSTTNVILSDSERVTVVGWKTGVIEKEGQTETFIFPDKPLESN